MQSAQDARKTAFESLLNQNQAVPINQAYINRMAPVNPYANGGYNQAPNSTVQPVYQSQTLAGGTKDVPVIQNTQNGGVSTNVSSGLGFAGRAFTSQGIGYPNSLGALGFFGLGLTGFGTRNGFRF
jgi:hypothetical protein